MSIDYEALREQNFLTQYVKDKPDIFSFLLKTAYTAYKSRRMHIIYTPAFEGVRDDLFGKSISTVVSSIKKKSNDEDITFDDFYRFLIFSVYATPMILKKVDIIQSITVTGGDLPETINFQQFLVSHSANIEDEFNEKKGSGASCFLYHGSPIENWYSIMRNGLKYCDVKSKFYLHGNAYGPGIYLSDGVGLSQGYSGGTYSDVILAVFEVVGTKNKYQKTGKHSVESQYGNIFVVTDEKALILRYILSYPVMSLNCTTASKQLNEYFNKEIHEERQQQVVKFSQCINKRLMNDIKMVHKIDTDKIGVNVIIDDENMFCWKIFLKDFGDDSLLTKDLKKYDISNVELEILFPSNYPMEPPFVRIVRPRFQYLTGHITVGGSICTELLTSKGWTPSMCIENLLVNIRFIILEGEGRIDPAKYKQEYSFAEAKEAFNRVASRYGWIR